MIFGSTIPKGKENTMNAIATDFGITPISGQTGPLESRISGRPVGKPTIGEWLLISDGWRYRVRLSRR